MIQKLEHTTFGTLPVGAYFMRGHRQWTVSENYMILQKSDAQSYRVSTYRVGVDADLPRRRGEPFKRHRSRMVDGIANTGHDYISLSADWVTIVPTALAENALRQAAKDALTL